jgi:hypothetical protein
MLPTFEGTDVGNAVEKQFTTADMSGVSSRKHIHKLCLNSMMSATGASRTTKPMLEDYTSPATAIGCCMPPLLAPPGVGRPGGGGTRT